MKKVFRSKIGAKLERKRSKNRAKTGVCEISQPLRNQHFAAKPLLAHECHFAAQEPPFRSCETVAKLQSVKIPNFVAKAPFCREFRSCETTFGTRVPFCSVVTRISQLRNGYEPPKHERSHFCWESSILQDISRLRNHFLAHECHLEALYNHFAAAKPPHLKILQRAHHEQTCHSRTPISAIVGHISITFQSLNYVCNISFQSL